MKKIYWLILLILVIGAGFLLKANVKNIQNNNGNGIGNLQNREENQTAEKQVYYSTTSIAQTDSFYNIKAQYPQFNNASKAFNNEIKNFISDRIDSYKKDAKDTWDARNATLQPGEQFAANPPEPFDFIASWTLARSDSRYISFVINVYYFTGGAHGITETEAFNFDISKNKDITINDFLGDSQTGLQKLAQLSAQQVAAQMQANNVQMDSILTGMINAGTKPIADNFSSFTFTDNFFTVYFQQYQVAPGYIGPITINLSKTLLSQNGITSDYLE
jgi:hypothetical protein